MNYSFSFLLLLLSCNVCLGQKVVFIEDYKSVTDVDNNNWEFSLEFKKGDTAEYIGRSKVDQNYYKLKAKGAIVFAYKSTFKQLDNFIEAETNAILDEESRVWNEKIRLQDEQIAKALKENEAIKAKKIKERDDRIRVKYGQATLDRLNREGLYIGMGQGLVLEWLGQPKKVNRTVNSNGVKEQWVYDNRYCYIENGKLVSWQESY
ncbi:MAG: hypothetical protein KBF45_07855 [Cyclobacteriaceae bacterium]|jgi:hypothetical protein|nr:hypothetical protein [Cyclobacteriaceae bacterium]